MRSDVLVRSSCAQGVVETSIERYPRERERDYRGLAKRKLSRIREIRTIKHGRFALVISLRPQFAAVQRALQASNP